MDRFDGEEDVFAEAAVAAYKSFLVVKCVETLARDRCAPLKPTGVPTRPAEQLGMTSPRVVRVETRQLAGGPSACLHR